MVRFMFHQLFACPLCSLYVSKLWKTLVAHNDPGCLPTCQSLFSLCHFSTPQHLPAGKLVPLPIPNHPWSHIGINLATDLPPSESYTCILVVVNRFSKACMLIPFERVTHSIINCRIAVPSCFPPLQTTRRPLCLRLWAPIHIPSLVFLLSYAGYFHQPQTNGQTERNIQAIER